MLRVVVLFNKLVDTGHAILGEVLQGDDLTLGSEDARLITRLQGDGYCGEVLATFLIAHGDK